MKLGRIMFAPEGGAGGSGTPAGTPPPTSTSILNTQPPVSTPAAAAGGASSTPPVATPSIKFSELIGEDGGLKDNWTDLLPDDVKGDACFKSIKTFPALAKSFQAAQRLVGADKVALPGKNSTKEEREAFFNKLGRPETPEGYKFVKPENVPADKWDDTRVKAFAAKAHSMGITQEQFAELLNYDTELKLQGMQQSEQAKTITQTENMGKLQTKWGAAFHQQLAKAQRGASLAPGGIKFFEDKGLADDPEILEFLADIGGKISEDHIRGTAQTLVPSDALSKIKEIQGNKQHPYNIKDHPAHKNAVAEMERLFAQAYPEPKK